MSVPGHPWLPQPPDEAPRVEGPMVPRATGPVSPQGVPAPSRALPVVDRMEAAELWWVGAHGGAGESTLAGLRPGWIAAGHGWPRLPRGLWARVVLVARSNVTGLLAARAAAMQWAAGAVPYVELLGLAVVADAPGRLPKPLRDLTQLVGGGAPRLWTVPWVEGWRLGEATHEMKLPSAVRRLTNDLQVLTGAGVRGAG